MGTGLFRGFDVETINPDQCRTELGRWCADRLVTLVAGKIDYDEKAAVYNGRSHLQEWLSKMPDGGNRDRQERALRRIHGNILADAPYVTAWKWSEVRNNESPDEFFDREAARMLAEGVMRVEWEDTVWERKIAQDNTVQKLRKAKAQRPGPPQGHVADAAGETEYREATFAERRRAGKAKLVEWKEKEKKYSEMLQKRAESFYANTFYDLFKLNEAVADAIDKTGVHEEITRVVTERSVEGGLSDEAIKRKCEDAAEAFRNISMSELVTSPGFTITAQMVHEQDKAHGRFMNAFLKHLADPRLRRRARASFVYRLELEGYDREHAEKLVEALPRWGVKPSKGGSQGETILMDPYTNAWNKLKHERRENSVQALEDLLTTSGLKQEWGTKIFDAVISVAETNAHLSPQKRALYVNEIQRKAEKLFGAGFRRKAAQEKREAIPETRAAAPTVSAEPREAPTPKTPSPAPKPTEITKCAPIAKRDPEPVAEPRKLQVPQPERVCRGLSSWGEEPEPEEECCPTACPDF